MDLQDTLTRLRHLARADAAVRERLLASREAANAAEVFCREAAALGYPLNLTELAFAGEADYATMRRATNGGGENSPVLLGEDDYYDLFMSELEAMRYADKETNKETIAAMLEAERIANDPSVKGYNDLDEMFAELGK